jgi:hypothetical protein
MFFRSFLELMATNALISMTNLSLGDDAARMKLLAAAGGGAAAGDLREFRSGQRRVSYELSTIATATLRGPVFRRFDFAMLRAEVGLFQQTR